MSVRAQGMDVPLVPNAGDGEERESREAQAGCWSTLTFGWLSSLIREGYRREMLRGNALTDACANGATHDEPTALVENDLFELRPDDLPQYLSGKALRSLAPSALPAGSGLRWVSLWSPCFGRFLAARPLPAPTLVRMFRFNQMGREGHGAAAWVGKPFYAMCGLRAPGGARLRKQYRLSGPPRSSLCF